MSKTFHLVRDNIDPDQWRLVLDGKYVYASFHECFLTDAAMPHLVELAADNTVQSIECVITTKVHYDQLMAEAERAYSRQAQGG